MQSLQELVITEDCVCAFAICERKSYKRLFLHSRGSKQSYAFMLDENRKIIEDEYFKLNPDFLSFNLDILTGKSKYILNAHFQIEQFVVNNTYLKRKESKSRLGAYSYEPILFSNYSKITEEDRMRVFYVGYVLKLVQDKQPEKATVVLSNGNKKNIKLDGDIHLPILDILSKWIASKPQMPKASFNKHCLTCQYENQCIVDAEREDSISLLSNMPLTVIKKYGSKGIFTIDQLSYLY